MSYNNIIMDKPSGSVIWIFVCLIGVSICQQVTEPEDSVIKYQILEEQQPNTLIGNLIADAKLDEKYSEDILSKLKLDFLSHSSKYKEYFIIDENTGLFRTQQSLDRDVICMEQVNTCLIHLDVAVEPVQYFEIIKVSVEVLDINDNYPTFPESRISLSISETTSLGASFAIPGAEDADTGLFGVQNYQLMSSGSSSFELRNNDGTTDSDLQLVLTDKLDREIKDSYELTIIAKDGGIPKKSGSVIVEITILDVNDNNPQFVNKTYSAYVYENIPGGSVILTVKANDEDKGLNGEVTYEFSRVTQRTYGYLFEINSFTGEIYSKDVIDYETHKEFTLGVVAKDKGPNALTDYAKVIIHVRDVNDHAPQITINAMSESGVVQIQEASPDGSFVAHISVADMDSQENGKFMCSLQHNSFRLIQLFSTEYKIVSSEVFDREIRNKYSLTIVCQDKGTDPQSASQELQVDITDVNDHAPQFDAMFYAVTLRENNSIGEVLIQVNASDLDMGQNAEIDYSLNGDHANMLHIDTKTGTVSTKGKFDYEKKQEFQFIVIANDKGQPPLSATVTMTVTVLDINDNVPQFPQKSYTFGTFENQASGTEIGTMEAFDLDTAPFDSIVYSFDYTQGDVGTFKIDAYSGKITTRKVLDREEKDTYRLVVIARNDGFLLSSTVNVVIYVADQNDNAPVISFPIENNNTVQVSAFVLQDDPVTFIEAYDSDIANNAHLTFSILGGSGQELFGINAFTGQVFVKEDLSVYAEQTVQLTVLVQDQGDPSLSSISDLYIHINASFVPINSGYSGITDLSETNLVIIVCLSIISVVLLVFVFLIVLLLRRHRNRRSNNSAHKTRGHDPSCVCKYCRVVKYVQYEQTQNKQQCQCTYMKDKDKINCPNCTQSMYLQMQPQETETKEPQKKSSFLKLFCAKNTTTSDAPSRSSKRKVHFVENEQVSTVPAYHQMSNSNQTSGLDDNSTEWPDLLERNIDQNLQTGDGRKYHPRRQRDDKQLMPLQVQSMLYPVAPDNGSDHGSSCDSGHGPSEEEQDHSRHSNNLSDHHLSPSHSGFHQLSPISSNPGYQSTSGSCSLHNKQNNRHSKCAVHNPNLSSAKTKSPWSSPQYPVANISSFADKQNVQSLPPRVPLNCIKSKPLPDLPANDEESGEECSDGDSTTTSGSYMVDTILDLSGHGPQISPRDVYV